MGLPVGVTGSMARSAPLREPVADRQSRHLAPGRWSPRDLRGGVAPGPRRRRRGQSPVKWSLAAGHHRSVVNLVVKKREPYGLPDGAGPNPTRTLQSTAKTASIPPAAPSQRVRFRRLRGERQAAADPGRRR